MSCWALRAHAPTATPADLQRTPAARPLPPPAVPASLLAAGKPPNPACACSHTCPPTRPHTQTRPAPARPEPVSAVKGPVVPPPHAAGGPGPRLLGVALMMRQRRCQRTAGGRLPRPGWGGGVGGTRLLMQERCQLRHCMRDGYKEQHAALMSTRCWVGAWESINEHRECMPGAVLTCTALRWWLLCGSGRKPSRRLSRSPRAWPSL